MKIEELIEKGYLKKIKVNKELIEKEIKEAEYDLERAKISLNEKDYKWAIVKSYYSAFHAARAFLFFHGLKERSHSAIVLVLEEFAKKGKFNFSLVEDFRSMLIAREGADYRGVYFQDVAEHIFSIAKEFVEKVERLLSKSRSKTKI